MSGRIEGERPRGERTPQQPSQPEHMQPLQGRAEGKQSLQGPTTVDRSEQLQPSRDLPITPQEQPQPESEEASPQAKRKRGRPKLSEYSEEERLRRRVERLKRSQRCNSLKTIEKYMRLNQYLRQNGGEAGRLNTV